MKQVYKWCENILIVDGYLRSCIYDLQRSKYELVPKETKKLLKKIEGLEFDEILNTCSDEEMYWVNHFISMEFLIIVPKSLVNCFQKINTDFNQPSHISNAIIEDSETIETTFNLLGELGCRHLHLIVENELRLTSILESYFSQTDYLSVSATIESLIGDVKVIDEVCKNYPILSTLIVKSDFIESGRYSAVNVCRYIDDTPEDPIFILNYDVFFESIQNHLYYNKKIYIDKFGNIKNSQNCSFSKANINEIKTSDTFLELLKDEEFVKKWRVSKDKTLVCLDCEFRRMCFDKEGIIELDNGLFQRNTECSYNPYISKWKNDTNYQGLKEIGVQISNNKLKISHARVRKINSRLWMD